MDFGAAAIALLTGGIVKIAVMALGGWLLFRLWRAERVPSPRRRWLVLPADARPTVRILRWALVAFCVSELTCGVEVYVLLRSSPITSAIHAFTSAAGMGLFALGLYRLVDERILRFGEARCRLRPVCRGCTLAGGGCRFRVTALLAATLVAIAALLPLAASTARMVADTRRWILPFPSLNAWYDRVAVRWLSAHFASYRATGLAFELPPSMFTIELRCLPLAALAIALAAARRFARGDVAAGARRLAFAAGVLSYSYFELVLYRGTGDVLLGSLAHEVAEYWFLLFTVELLRRWFAPEPARA